MPPLDLLRSDVVSRRYLESGVLSIGAIVGIAVGGFLMLVIVLTSVGIRYARNNHRRRRTSQAIDATDEEIDIKSALQSTRPLDARIQRRFQCNPFFAHRDGVVCRDCVEANPIQHPPTARPKNLSDPKGFLRISGMRDSWPLASGLPLGFLPSQQTMILNRVAPPGYIVAPPVNRWPRRSSSKSAQNKVFVHFPDSDIKSDSTDSHLKALSSRPQMQRRSTSESQLSTILRSTSQRLKSSQRNSLTRTMSTFDRLPGWPPSDNLPDLPRVERQERQERQERHESLEEAQDAGSDSSSIYESYLEPSPCLGKRASKKLCPAGSNRGKSPTPSAGSDDSLCGKQTPDLVIPTLLSSPSKRDRRHERRHRMSISQGSNDLGAMVHKNNRASTGILGTRESVEEEAVFSSPHRISLSSDPFYSSVKSSKPVFPKTQIPDPQPLYVRKATFGQEAITTTERPLGYTSPLRDVSGNAQSPLRRNESMETVMNNSPDHNPFQWSPQEAMQTRPSTTNPKRNEARRKGHKRSNVIRMSNLPRPQSIIDDNLVLEEPADETSHRLSFKSRPPVRIFEPTKSARPISLQSIKSNRRLGFQPPTSATFNPSLAVPEMASRSMDNSPTLGEVDIPNIYSPTLSVCNYYTEASDSENEFFRAKKPSAEAIKARRHGRNYSADFPRDGGRPISFLPLSGETLDTPKSLPSHPPNRPLPSITSSTAGLVPSTMPSPAPPVLTMPIPGHLTGPRPEPGKQTRDILSPPRDSLETTVGMLRRMNSEISQTSHYSIASAANEDGSPSLPAHRAHLSSTNLEDEERGRSRGSKHYLSVGNSPSKTRQRPEKRDSHRIYKERRLRRMHETLNSELMDLTPVRETSSPATGPNALGIVGLRFPTVASSGHIGATPSKSPIQKSSPSAEVRWSDAMVLPAVSSVRRESKMEHPSPQTPPKWGWGNKALGVGLVGSKTNSMVDGQENINSETGRRAVLRGSLELYDQDGFLKSSPGKEKVESGSGSKLRSFVM